MKAALAITAADRKRPMAILLYCGAAPIALFLEPVLPLARRGIANRFTRF